MSNTIIINIILINTVLIYIIHKSTNAFSVFRLYIFINFNFTITLYNVKNKQ